MYGTLKQGFSNWGLETPRGLQGMIREKVYRKTDK